MMKLFLRRHLGLRPLPALDRTDPLAHPAIARMSQRELADLPLCRH